MLERPTGLDPMLMTARGGWEAYSGSWLVDWTPRTETLVRSSVKCLGV